VIEFFCALNLVVFKCHFFQKPFVKT